MENFTVVSSILDTLFFNEKGEIIRLLAVKLVFLIQTPSGLQREGDEITGEGVGGAVNRSAPPGGSLLGRDPSVPVGSAA